MSNVFTLESLVEEIEREYAPLRFRVGEEEFVLRSLLRVAKNDRDAVIERLKSLEADEDSGDSAEELEEHEALAAAQYVLSKVTADGRGNRLVSLLADDLLVCMKLLNKWAGATQPGEARDSPA